MMLGTLAYLIQEELLFSGINVSTRRIDAFRLAEALRHKTGDSGSDSRYGPSKFSSDLLLLYALSSTWFHSASKSNEYQGIS